MTPAGRSFVILEEYRLVVGDEDEWKRMGMWKQISVVVPNLELRFVIHPSINKGISIGHNINSFMAIKIHPVLPLSISPLQFGKPPMSC